MNWHEKYLEAEYELQTERERMRQVIAALKGIIDVEHHDSDKRYVDELAPLIVRAIQVLEEAVR